MGRNIKIEKLSETIMEGLKEYADVTTDNVKDAARKTAKEVKSDIAKASPKRTGAYAKSWSVKKQKENSNTISLVVHSRNKYQLTHLLEFGHAKRGGGRVKGKEHIEPAEKKAISSFEIEVKRCIEDG